MAKRTKDIRSFFSNLIPSKQSKSSSDHFTVRYTKSPAKDSEITVLPKENAPENVIPSTLCEDSVSIETKNTEERKESPTLKSISNDSNLKKTRCFNNKWCREYKWLEYDEKANTMIFFVKL